jgi:hypothetical protein
MSTTRLIAAAAIAVSALASAPVASAATIVAQGQVQAGAGVLDTSFELYPVAYDRPFKLHLSLTGAAVSLAQFDRTVLIFHYEYYEDIGGVGLQNPELYDATGFCYGRQSTTSVCVDDLTWQSEPLMSLRIGAHGATATAYVPSVRQPELLAGPTDDYDALAGDETWSVYAEFVADRAVSYRVTMGAAPEPSIWALMIGGFGLVGTALRWRSRARA